MGGEINNLIEVWSSTIASLCYCYLISSRIPKGKYRLLSLLPIFSLFIFLPLRLTYAFTTAVTVTTITWLADSKLLLFAFDLGPLSPDPPLSLALFITVACLPLSTVKQNQKNPEKPRKILLSFAIEVVIFAILCGFLGHYREVLHPQILLVVYCFVVFLLVEFLMVLSNGVVRATAGLELDPPSDEPYLSTSLQDFWGKRWNLTVGNILRCTVYEPVRSAMVAVVGSRTRWAPLAAGVLASFLVSGLMHEMLLYYVARASPSWEMTGFFVLHGVGVATEMGVKRAVSSRWRLPWAVSWLLTVAFVVVTSVWLFFPPLIRNRADMRLVEEFYIFMELAKSNLILIAEEK